MIGHISTDRRNLHVAYLLLAILAVAALTPVDTNPQEVTDIANLAETESDVSRAPPSHMP